MSDINETIQESVEHARESKLNGRVALLVAICATFMAICNIKDGNIVQSMSQAQAHSIDAWSHYQAKSTRENITENSLDMIKMQNLPGSDTMIPKLETKIATYESEKMEIKKEAEGYVKEYDDINVFDDQFDMTEAFLSIAIAMLGVTALTQKRWLLYFAGSVGLAGMIFGLTAFMKISLHSDFISKILG